MKLAAATLLVCLVATARAEVRVSLPQGNAYRVGQFITVAVENDNSVEHTVTLCADVVPTVVTLRSAERAMVPVLVLRGDAGLTWSMDTASAREFATPLVQTTTRPADDVLPVDALDGEAVYAAIGSWSPGWPMRVRRNVALSGVLIALAYSACLLPRGKTRIALAAAVTIAACVVLERWRNTLPTATIARGEVLVVDRAETRADAWTFATALTDEVDLRLSLDGATPIFVDAKHARDLQARVLVDGATNRTLLSIVIPRGGKVAVVARGRASAKNEKLDALTPSPLAEIARRLYVSPEFRIEGQRSAAGFDWPVVVLKRN
ncbi:MAG: hypothetical protein ACREJC_23085 [Tepidisphaeraceae bacterium]